MSPKRAPRPCRHRGCPSVVDNKEGFCDDHMREHRRETKARHRRYNQKRQSSPEERELQRFYRTPAWRNIRKSYITDNPLCHLCSQLGRLTVGTVVDHIVERRDGGENFNYSNLQTLCHRCHTVKTQEERKKRRVRGE